MIPNEARVEAAAKAICERDWKGTPGYKWNHIGDLEQQEYREAARAALGSTDSADALLRDSLVALERHLSARRNHTLAMHRGASGAMLSIHNAEHNEASLWLGVVRKVLAGKCFQCSGPAVTVLDNDALCKRHADEWVRAEGIEADNGTAHLAQQS
ncbi:hypothetical protein [Aurantiacibacter zhengii]|uniref:Uncharacterized protein n=1 Tax=Aurantiacibacter zhengii TaxID=2307003 RepID=A0A418NU62_9SPHN|nr:hypothetical protein [Aurantiacibacter zhengii]RIV87470.1 hypothetical protein D2V07_03730 [Aurantiacibacter zhengii]